MNGYLLFDKPKTWTSFDVVAKVRGIAQAANRHARATAEAAGTVMPQQLAKRVKVGHTGTLDPLATGLLVILVGNYTKRAGELTKLDKSYQVVMKLGQVSTTADDEGLKSFVSALQPSLDDIKLSLQKFTGHIIQTPPAYSAIKIDGVRAYQLARQGKPVAMAARPAYIASIELITYDYPNVTFIADVSSGTYIRSLVQDLGNQLTTGAYMSDLRRTRVGQFELSAAVTIDVLQRDGLQLLEL